MEDKILELLQVMNAKLDKNSSDIADMKYEMATMNSKITRLEEGQKSIKLTVDSIKCKVDEMTNDMHRVEVATAQNWTDIAILKSINKQ
ncbi:hypothetical protein [Clostridium butyricum]|uniref:hypothetical protein n=1 Tax=Clostridium butyricum TaxID=1492 RepID=UPI001F567A32|nr:hypothetical protein [Clostridium butyricum]